MTEILNIGGVRDRSQIIGLGAYWKDVRREYVNGVLIYEGKHYEHDTPESADDWAIWKFTPTADGNVREEGPLVGAWSGRGALDWGSGDVRVSKKLEYEQTSVGLFEEIIYQLKMMNVQLMSITDEHFNDGDLEL